MTEPRSQLCLAEGMLVMVGMADAVPIELIKPADYVMGFVSLKNQQVVRVLLDNGQLVESILDHRFMRLDGIWVEAKDLLVRSPFTPHGLSLMRVVGQRRRG